jgi:hypothetical protein
MKLSDRVKIKDEADVDLGHRDRKGTVVADTAPGSAVKVEFDDETVPYSFKEKDVELISVNEK